MEKRKKFTVERMAGLIFIQSINTLKLTFSIVQNIFKGGILKIDDKGLNYSEIYIKNRK